jgi:hypothetical protein
MILYFPLFINIDVDIHLVGVGSMNSLSWITSMDLDILTFHGKLPWNYQALKTHGCSDDQSLWVDIYEPIGLKFPKSIFGHEILRRG